VLPPKPWAPQLLSLAQLDQLDQSPPSPPIVSNNSSRLVWLLLALSALAATVWFLHARGYWEDDAWIHLVFARSLASGQGFTFNGSVVYGDTSPLWVWLLVAFHALIPSWIAAGKTLCAVGALFALTGVFVLARSLTLASLGPQRARLFAAAMVLLLVLNPYFGFWAFSGMEALTAAGLACFGLWIANRNPLSPAWLLAGALVAGLAPLLRPEMGFFSILLALVLVWRLWYMRAALATKAMLFAAGIVLLLTPFALWARYALHAFGSVLPTTNAAKRAGPAESIVRHVLSIYLAGFPVALAGLVLLAAWLLSRRRTPDHPPAWKVLPAGTWLILAWSAINLAFYVVNHTYVQTRYLFVTAPVLTIVLLAAAAVAWPRIYRLLLAAGIVAALAVSTLAAWPSLTNTVLIVHDVGLLSAVIRTLPPGVTVADYSIGEVAFLSGHPILDTGGILEPAVIPFLWDKDEFRRLAWARAQGATYIVEWDANTSRGTIVWQHDFPATGWYLNHRRYAERQKLILWKLPEN
jgi:hypothetical protein